MNIDVIGRASIVELLIRNGANVNATDHTNRTPLYMAAEIGDILLHFLFKINKIFRNKTFIMIRMLHNSLGNEKIVDTLIKSGADVNRKNNDGWSPLQTAAFNGNIQMKIT